jgi:CRISPR-associated protein Cas5t
MNAYKFKITTWTSSFRYPNIISGFQPTLEVPPISTILGLFNAASGKYNDYKNCEIGYYFDYQAKATDVETIYQIDKIAKDNSSPSLKATSNIIKREFLWNCRLIVYIKDEYLKNALLSPVYSLLLGRSSDLAQVKYLGEIELQEEKNASKIKGEIIPLFGNYLPGIIQPLPQYFTNTRVRRNIGTQPYSIIDFKSVDFPTHLTAYRDDIDGREVDIYFHELNFENGV